MKFKEIKDLLTYPVRLEIKEEKKLHDILIHEASNYDEYEITMIGSSHIKLKAPDKYKQVREFVERAELKGKERLVFANTSGETISIVSSNCSAGLKIFNANTLEDKIKVLKILYGGNDEA